MGEIADLIIEGYCCAECSIYFEEPHGYPVLCNDCWNSRTKEEREGYQKSIYKEA